MNKLSNSAAVKFQTRLILLVLSCSGQVAADGTPLQADPTLTTLHLSDIAISGMVAYTAVLIRFGASGGKFTLGHNAQPWSKLINSWLVLQESTKED
jgi:hypothetical protein